MYSKTGPTASSSSARQAHARESVVGFLELANGSHLDRSRMDAARTAGGLGRQHHITDYQPIGRFHCWGVILNGTGFGVR